MAQADIGKESGILGQFNDRFAQAPASLDASTREQAFATIPLFGPDCRKAAGPNLLYAIQHEKDVNVRLAAIAAVPIIGFEESLRQQAFTALTEILKRADVHPSHTRYEAAMALGNCGPVARDVALPVLIELTCRDFGSWQNRKAAAYALGRLGLSTGLGPDVRAINELIRMLQVDTSHVVRREAINSLLLLGPPYVEAPWRKLRETLHNFATLHADMSDVKNSDKSIRPLVASRLHPHRTGRDQVE